MVLHLKNLESLHPRMHCGRFGWKWSSGSWEEGFWILSMYFCYFIIISPWKRAGCLHLYKLGSPSPKDVLCQVWLKLVQWFLRRFLNFVNVFLLFHNIISLWKTWIPFTKECIMPSLVEIGPVVLVKKIFLNFVNIFLLFGNNLPLEQTWTPSTQGCFVPSLVEIGPVNLVKKMKMWKVYRQTERQTDRRQTKSDQKSSLELSAQVS